MVEVPKRAAEGLGGWLAGRWGLRFPGLFLLFAALFLVDLAVPDFIPFVDEIGFGILTALFGLWRRRREPSRDDVAPPSP